MSSVSARPESVGEWYIAKPYNKALQLTARQHAYQVVLSRRRLDADRAPQLKAIVGLPAMFHFEDQQVTETGPCECCGDTSRLATGLVRLDDAPYAAYQVHWTANQVARHGAEFYLILGEWGDGTTAADKFAVAIHYFVEPDRSGFAVVDADQTPIASNPLVGRALSRESVVGTPLADDVFHLVDAIWLGDQNISEVAQS